MIKFLPWHLDKWLSQQGSLLAYDKLEHFLAAVISLFIFNRVFKWSIKTSVIVALLLGIAWEIKDGIIPYDWDRGLIQGFSWKDLIADIAGILVGAFFTLFVMKKTSDSVIEKM